jgi:hypothetical protein
LGNNFNEAIESNKDICNFFDIEHPYVNFSNLDSYQNGEFNYCLLIKGIYQKVVFLILNIKLFDLE